MESPGVRAGRVLPLLKKPLFRRLWGAQFSSMVVVYGLSLAGVVLVEERTHSSAQTGLTILSSILPAFVGSLVAGAVVDRFGRARVLRWSHLSRAVAALAFWVGTERLPGYQVLPAVYGANVVVALLTQFAAPAEMALLPDLVDPGQLVPANSLFQFSLLISEGMGIIFLGPLVIKLLGAPAMGGVGSLLYLLALALIAPLPQDDRVTAPAAGAEEPSRGRSFLADLRAGWQVMGRDRQLALVAIQMTLASALLLVVLALLPGLVSRHLGLPVEDAPWLILPGGVGFLLGTLLLNHWEHRLSRHGWIAIGLVGAGGSIGFLAVLAGVGGARLVVFLAFVLALGIALAMVVIPGRTVLQERPPEALRGRVIAAQLALGNAAAVLPLFLGGALADQLGIRPVMGALGVLALGAGAVGLWSARA